MKVLDINVGYLNSPSALYFSIRKGLDEFNVGWQQGLQPSVRWDLRQIVAGKINVGAVAFFLAVAHRVRQFTGQRQEILIEWHPKRFGFLSDVGFFDIADSYDLFLWPYEIGGFDHEVNNPNTKIMSFEKAISSPPLNDGIAVSEWKKIHREKYRAEIINKCESLFLSTDKTSNRKLPLIMSRTCAELVTNSLLWGDATSFVSLQRVKNKIFINVCDIGRGFRFSLFNKGVYNELAVNPNNDVIAVGLGCVINENDFGLKRAISTVLELGGDITISSNNGEVHWGRDVWGLFVGDINENGLVSALNSLPSKARYDREETKKINNERGFVRNLPSSVRGTRISFYIPLVEGRG